MLLLLNYLQMMNKVLNKFVSYPKILIFSIYVNEFVIPLFGNGINHPEAMYFLNRNHFFLKTYQTDVQWHHMPVPMLWYDFLSRWRSSLRVYPEDKGCTFQILFVELNPCQWKGKTPFIVLLLQLSNPLLRTFT